MAKKKKFDYVVSLLTGRFQGKTFIPETTNPHPPLPYLLKAKDVQDEDSVLVAERLRNPKLKINREEFKKSNKEKRNLKYFKKLHYKNMRSLGLNPKKELNYPGCFEEEKNANILGNKSIA